MSGRLKLGQILVSKGLIDPDQLATALGEQRQGGARLGMTLVRLGYLEEEVLIRVLASQLRLPVVRIAGKTVGDEVLELVPVELAEKHRCLPLFLRRDEEGPVLLLAMEDPTDSEALEEIGARSEHRVRPVLVGPAELEDALQRHYHTVALMPASDDGLPPVRPPEAGTSEAPVDAAHALPPPGRGLDPAADASASGLDLELPLDGSADAPGDSLPDTRPDTLFDDSFDSLHEADVDVPDPFELAASRESDADDGSYGAELDPHGGVGLDSDSDRSGAGRRRSRGFVSGDGATLAAMLGSDGEAGADPGHESDAGASGDGGLESDAGFGGDLGLESDAGFGGDGGQGSDGGASLDGALESGPGASLDDALDDPFGASVDSALGATLDGRLVLPAESRHASSSEVAPARSGLDPQLILRALSQLLVEKGVITRDELAERLRRVAAESRGHEGGGA